MGVANLVSSSGGGGLASAVKSVQRGEAVSAGTITISSVDTTKTQVSSFSTGAAGTVAATGSVGASTGNTAYSYWGSYTTMNVNQGNGQATWPATFPANITYENYFNGPHAQYGGRYGQTLNAYYFSYATATNTLSYISLGASNITGGSTNVTSAAYGAYLSGATSLVVTGPCRYEVVEYY
jgi:hypothetical protein